MDFKQKFGTNINQTGCYTENSNWTHQTSGKTDSSNLIWTYQTGGKTDSSNSNGTYQICGKTNSLKLVDIMFAHGLISPWVDILK